jgi:hypothetical protein
VKYLKMLGLAAIAAAALAAFAGSGTASATVLCSTANPCPAGQNWPASTVFDFSLEPETSLVWKDGEGNVLETCKGVTLRAKITNVGGASSTVTAENTTLD